MITITAKSLIKEGKEEDFKILAIKLVQESRKEKGCLSYNLYKDLKNPNIFTFIEEWKNEEAIKLHNDSIHFTTIVPKMAELREGKPEINLYQMIKGEFL